MLTSETVVLAWAGRALSNGLLAKHGGFHFKGTCVSILHITQAAWAVLGFDHFVFPVVIVGGALRFTSCIFAVERRFDVNGRTALARWQLCASSNHRIQHVKSERIRFAGFRVLMRPDG